jgi:DNA segregation ATPase FtsK/SpoIIIE-like protein
VLVVDELADLMMSVQAEIEKPLAQLAQKSRAIGIHLSWRRSGPSVNVITGLIKANFPCRIAFRVSSKVDSRTIIDQNGADALLGNGDMLFLPPGTSDPVRIQGAYISTEDTEQMMDWYRATQAEKPAREEDILEMVRAREAAERRAMTTRSSRSATRCSARPPRSASSSSRARRRCCSGGCASATAALPASSTSSTTPACSVRPTVPSRAKCSSAWIRSATSAAMIEERVTTAGVYTHHSGQLASGMA